MVVDQRLSERLESIFDYGPDDEGWVRHVRDHKKYLKRNAPVSYFRPEELVKYRYRPQDFYVDKCSGKFSQTWIFLFVNDIRNPSDFNENCNKLFMVQPSQIEELYNVYSTSENRNRET